MLFDSESDRLIRDQNVQRIRDDDRLRRDRMAERYALLQGDFEHLVRREVQGIFRNPDTRERVQTLNDTTLNPFRVIVEEIYRHPGAQRAFVHEGPEGTTEDPTFQALQESLSLQRVMALATKFAGAFNDSLIQVLPGREPGDPPRLRVFAPHEVTVVPDPEDPSRPSLIAYEIDKLGDRWTVVWTATDHYQIDPKGRIHPVFGNDGSKNPLGFLPFVCLHAGDRPDSFWDTSTHEALFRATLQLAALGSAETYAVLNSNFSQPVIITADPNFQPPPSAGIGTLWVLKQPQVQGAPQSQVTSLSMSADLIAARAAADAKLAQVLSSYGVSREAFLRTGAAPTSGFARLLERQPLLERRNQFLPFVEDAEYDLADLIRRVWNLTSSPEIPASAAFQVKFEEEPVIQSPQELEAARKAHLDNLKLELDLGLRTKVEVVAAERGVSLEEAEAILEEIEAAKPAPQATANPFASLLKPRA